jgi:phage FluMu gp28-like protein
MATELLRLYEDRRIRHPRDAQLRDDLRKPERVTSPGGRVSIAATRDEAGHADHFWSLALAIEAAGKSGEGGAMQIIHREPKKLWL